MSRERMLCRVTVQTGGVAGKSVSQPESVDPGPWVSGVKVDHARPRSEVSKYFDHNKWGTARHAFTSLAW